MKKTSWSFIPFYYYSGYKNMAIDSLLLQKRMNCEINNTIRFYGWKPSTVSIGVHQELDAEVDIDIAKQQGIQIVRRITGGGAVFHQFQKELTYSVVMDCNDLDSSSIDDSFREISQGIIEGLKMFGIKLVHDKIHCPSIFTQRDHKKISGNAQARKKNYLLQHGTILLDYDPDLMYSVLRVKKGRTKSRMVKSVYQHVTTMYQQIKRQLLPEIMYKEIAIGFSRNFRTNIEWRHLTESELNESEQIAQGKFSSDSWIHKY